MRNPKQPICPQELTRRQIEVLELSMGGRTDEEVAQRLGTSEHTVKSQFRDMFNRTGMSAKIDLLNFVLANPHWIGIPKAQSYGGNSDSKNQSTGELLRNGSKPGADSRRRPNPRIA